MPVCQETRNRIRLSVAAYAYELLDDPFMSDAEFDSLSAKIDPLTPTDDADMDTFFRDHFDPSTGVWIRSHPNLGGIKRLYETYYNPNAISAEEMAQIERLI